MLPIPPPADQAPSCAEAGVLGVLPGIIGSLQAMEAIKLLLGLGDPLVGRLMAYDALEESFRNFKLRRDPECPACGENAPPIQIARIRRSLHAAPDRASRVAGGAIGDISGAFGAPGRGPNPVLLPLHGAPRFARPMPGRDSGAAGIAEGASQRRRGPAWR